MNDRFGQFQEFIYELRTAAMGRLLKFRVG